MEGSDSEPDSTPAQTPEESTASDQPDDQSDGHSSTLSRRAALASVAGLGGLTAGLSSPAQARRGGAGRYLVRKRGTLDFTGPAEWGNAGTYTNTVGTDAVVAGGTDNDASGDNAAIGGGEDNTASDTFATVCGGSTNEATALAATVAGGQNNTAAGTWSFAAGRYASAEHSGAFVWSGSGTGGFSSTGGNQFLVDAAGGTGIGTDSPVTTFHVRDAVAEPGGDNLGRHVAAVENTSSSSEPIPDVLGLELANVTDPGQFHSYISFLDSTGTIGNVQGDGAGNIELNGVTSVDTTGSDFTVEAGTTSTGEARNVVAGHASNEVDDAVGAVISGGGFDDGSTANQNIVRNDFGTVGGGVDNVAGAWDYEAPFATVSGGKGNLADREGATIGGGYGNRARATGATIAGGGNSEKSGFRNRVDGAFGTIGGGDDNNAGSSDDGFSTPYATVGGGWDNAALSPISTISGGSHNEADGPCTTVGGGNHNHAGSIGATVGGGNHNSAIGFGATVPGGEDNSAVGDKSFAAGETAKAADNFTFVWNDSTSYHKIDSDGNEGLSSSKSVAGSGVTGQNTFHASATGGFRFVTGSNSVTYIAGGSTGWATTSTRAAKTNVEPVDPREVLEGVEEMDVSTWEYRDDSGDGQGVTHIGPMAEDFHAAVDVGDSDEHINSINADGVAFAAVQGLAQRLDEKEADIDRLESTVERKDAELDALRDDVDSRDHRIDELEAETDELRAENEQLRERLRAVEGRLTSLEAEQSSAVADD